MKKLSATTAENRPEVAQDVPGSPRHEGATASRSAAEEQRNARKAIRGRRLGPAEALDVLGRLLPEDVGHVVWVMIPRWSFVVTTTGIASRFARSEVGRCLAVGGGPDADGRQGDQVGDGVVPR
jgi:hypothetical protein